MRISGLTQTGMARAVRTCLLSTVTAIGVLGASSSAALAAAPETPVTKPATDITGTTATLNGELNPAAVGEAGEYDFDYRQSASECTEGGIAPETPGTALGGEKEAVLTELTGLQPSAEYTFCVVATHEGESSTGAPVSFKTLAAPPTIAFQGAGAITPFAATLETLINPNNQLTSCELEYGPTTAYGTSAPCEPASLEGFGEQFAALPVAGLQPAATYHYRAVAENAAREKTEGADQEFTTLTAEAPVIDSESVTAITSGEPTLEARINPNFQQTSYRFEYATSEEALLKEEGTSIPGAAPLPAVSEELLAGPVDLGPLPPGPTYFYRVVATNATGTTDGNVESFLAVAKPAITTGAPTELAPTSATVPGTVNPAGAETTYHIRYISQAGYEAALGKAEAPFTLSKSTAPTGAGSSYETQSTRVTITELTPAATYHYQLIASNVVGTTTGPDQTFTTAPPTPPIATTGAAEGISQLSATINGSIDPRGLQTNAQFEFGVIPGAGALLPVTAEAGPGPILQISASFSGNLQPSTTYYYRTVASNSQGMSYGAEQSFTTSGFPAAFAPPTTFAFIPYSSIAELNAKEAKEGPKSPAIKPLSRAQKLAKALKACHKDKNKGKRARCKRQSREKYGPVRRKKK